MSAVSSQTLAKASNSVDINQLLLTTTSTDTFFRFFPFKIGGGTTEGSGVDTSCELTSSDGGRCVGLETVVPIDEIPIPLDLRLCTPFVLPLTFEETGGLVFTEVVLNSWVNSSISPWFGIRAGRVATNGCWTASSIIVTSSSSSSASDILGSTSGIRALNNDVTSGSNRVSIGGIKYAGLSNNS